MDRAEAARKRLLMAEAELGSPAVDLPCVQCRYWLLTCNHPAVAEIHVNPVTGAAKLKPTMTGEEARDEAGPCGPEAALFEPRSLPATVFVSMMSTSGGRWGLLGIGLGVAWLLGF